MHHFFVSPEQISDTEIRILGADVNHIRNVLRMKPGEELRVRTGEDDRDFRCRIRGMDETQIILEILWVDHTQAELPSRIWLFQGLPKSDKMELIIQKAAELGAARIVPVEMRRSVVKLSGAKAEAKGKRWNLICESAAKQSKRMMVPQVAPVASFSEALTMAQELDVLLFPYELAQDMTRTREVLGGIQPGQSIGIFIGPEGGFETEEAEALRRMDAEVITLGRRILRTETAGMAVLSMLLYLLEP